MSKQGRFFLLAFVPAAGVVAALVARGMPIVAVGVGTFAIVVHWWLSARSGSDSEIADSSYFFGFLLTLVFLASGLLMLRAPTDGGRIDVTRFLGDLAAGLVLTIVGLVVRQIRTLSAPASSSAGNSPANVQAGDSPGIGGGLTDAQRELAEAMRVLVAALKQRPEEVAVREFDDARARARTAAEELERHIAQSSSRMTAAVSSLEEAVNSAATTLTRSGSTLGSALDQAAERLQIHVTAVLRVIDTQRTALEESLRATQATAEQTQREVGEQMGAQLAEWRSSLEQAHAFFANTHAAIEAEYRRSVEAMSSSGKTFAELGERVAGEIEALPNPADRLTTLWASVQQLEAKLAASVDEASTQLGALSGRAREASTMLDEVGRSADVAARSVERGGAELGVALHDELQQMIRILEEYTALLEQSAGLARAR
jgi:ABC-type transporter Mla subunit MlaD